MQPPIRHFEYPQVVLDRVNAARHTPPAREAGSQYNFTVLHYKMHSPEDSESLVGHFSTLQEANQFALDYFKREFEDYFDQNEDMANFFETGEVCVEDNSVSGRSIAVARWI